MYVASLDTPGHKEKLLSTSYNALYAAPQDQHPGYLLWVREQGLVAQRFDLRSRSLSAETIPVADDVAVDSIFQMADFCVSPTGVLVYAGGGVRKHQMRWVNRKGDELDTVGLPDAYDTPRLSPDGKRLAFTRLDAASNWEHLGP